MLQAAIESQKIRFEARASTLEGQLAVAGAELAESQTQTSRLRALLDELTEDISRETQGRRREVLIRLKMVEREEIVVVALQNLVKQLEGDPQVCIGGEGECRALKSALTGITSIVGSLDEAVAPENGNSRSLPLGDIRDGSLARLISCHETSASLVDELQQETAKRLKLERKLGDLAVCTNLRVPDIELVTPSDLGIGESRETLVENPLFIHPISPFNQTHAITSPHPIGDNGLVGRPIVSGDPAGDPIETSVSKPRTTPVFVAQGNTADTATLTASKGRGVDGNSGVSPIGVSDPLSPGSAPVYVDDLRKGHSSVGDDQLGHGEFLRDSLEAIHGRYGPIRTALRCYRDILSEMKKSTDVSGDSDRSVTQYFFNELGPYVGRLNDFLEDTMVELEIRIADEKRIAQGYETLLSVHAKSETPGPLLMEEEARAFVSGADDGIAKSIERFRSKAEDLGHDIHLLRSNGAQYGSSPSLALNDDGSSAGSWSWSELVTPNRSRPPSPAPTFGAVIINRPLNNPEVTVPPPVDLSPPVDLRHLPFRISMPQATHTTLLAPSLQPQLQTSGSFSSMYSQTRTLSSSTVGGLSGGRRLSTGLGLGVGNSPRASLKSISRQHPSTDSLRQSTLLHEDARASGSRTLPRDNDTDGDGVE